MFALGLSLATMFVAVLPLLLAKYWLSAALEFVLGSLVCWLSYYYGATSVGSPMFGMTGLFVAVWWLINCVAHAAFVAKCNAELRNARTITDPDKNRDTLRRNPFVFYAGVVAVVLQTVTVFSGCALFRSGDYFKMIGDVEKREWSADVQPKDPHHVRLVPQELAYYLATKQLGEVPGAIGSQYEIKESSLTLQLVRGELWYVAPLDFKGFAVWSGTNNFAPGYVMVHGEDPLRQVIVKIGYKFRYMPGACLWDNLERYMWSRYPTMRFTDYSFELDDDGNPFWVVTAFEYAIGWSGRKVTGVHVINPVDGSDTFYPVGSVPKWIDRVYPAVFVKDNIEWWGEYGDGWMNAAWGHRNIMKPGSDPSLVYGADGDPYWVTDVTSNNKDDSMVGLMYTNARTGKSAFYHAQGGTEASILKLVNSTVGFRKLHGSGAVLYNIYGTMTYIVPLLGENHSFQGVAFADVVNNQVAVGSSVQEAVHNYQKLLANLSQTASPDKTVDHVKLGGTVSRTVAEIRSGDTTYYVTLEGVNKIFSGGADVSPTLRITKPGDKVFLEAINSNEAILPILRFENATMKIDRDTLESAGPRPSTRAAK